MKTLSLFSLAALAALAWSAHQAVAEQSRYTCKAGALTITSTSPCYVTSYGISVPGSDGPDQGGKQGGDAGAKNGGKKGGGFGGPKDLKDKPKGGGLNGPKDVKNKD
ncbi:hypothetical protein [Dongia rigui]|uniref:Uncharacterized protein n=1 Tax=Dongia rigui TaxID=940149 RepID=A0ABU5DUD3_9PROT|nr:hypothetical protein [Dongia rigui]MDY0870808.1 hypothetical protein [Dongia rigui]